jgi:hypothetical protein
MFGNLDLILIGIVGIFFILLVMQIGTIMHIQIPFIIYEMTFLLSRSFILIF